MAENTFNLITLAFKNETILSKFICTDTSIPSPKRVKAVNDCPEVGNSARTITTYIAFHDDVFK
jgi:hypothetical protein